MRPNRLSKYLMRFIFIISLLSTLGSLYYGYFGDPVQNIFTGELFNLENGLIACDLCRYVRICMFPLLFISGIALLKKDLGSVDYMMPLVVLAIIFSGYKYRLQKFAVTQETGFCLKGIPCSDIAVEYFGFATMPFLSGVACILILIAIILIYKKGR